MVSGICRPDAPVIYGLAKGLVDRYEDRTAIDYEKVLSWMERKINSHIDEYTCIVRQGQTVGYYRLCSVDGELELDDFYILPAFRNQGIGTRVLRKILSEANYPVFLYVFTENRGAVALYERMGFVKREQVSDTRCILWRKA